MATQFVLEKRRVEEAIWHPMAGYGTRNPLIEYFFLPFFLPPIFDNLEGQGILINRFLMIT